MLPSEQTWKYVIAEKFEDLIHVLSSRNEERQPPVITNGLRSLGMNREKAKSYDPNLELYHKYKEVGYKTQGNTVILLFHLCLDFRLDCACLLRSYCFLKAPQVFCITVFRGFQSSLDQASFLPLFYLLYRVNCQICSVVFLLYISPFISYCYHMVQSFPARLLAWLVRTSPFLFSL